MYYLYKYIYMYICIYLLVFLPFVFLSDMLVVYEVPIKLFFKSGSQNLVRLSKYISLAHCWMSHPLLYLLTYILRFWRPPVLISCQTFQEPV